MSTAILPLIPSTAYQNVLVAYLKAQTGQTPQVISQADGGPNATGPTVVVFGHLKNYTRLSDGSTFSWDSCSNTVDPYANDSAYAFSAYGPAVGYPVPMVPDISQASRDAQADFAVAFFGAPLSGDRVQNLINLGLLPLGQIPNWLYPTSASVAADITIDPATLPCPPQSSIASGATPQA